MSTVVKDLGAATAYGYAVEKGYTGTEEEFAELMASYATVGQTAVTAAQTATTKASEAATSAIIATNKASEATTAAQTASTKASEAVRCVETATQKATEATQSASQASGYAQTAETAKTDAQTAKTQAETARDNAVTAKTAAQTAQTGAETAAASVQSSAEQIATNAEDISQLKSNFADMQSDGAVPSAEQILTDKGVTDSVPYHYRKTGGDGADRLYDQIVGGTVCFNQLIDGVKNYTSTASDTRTTLSLLIRYGTGYGDAIAFSRHPIPVGVFAIVINTEQTSTGIRVYHNGASTNITLAVDNAFKWISGHKYLFIADFTAVDPTTVGGIKVSDMMMFDLTAMFGSTIADYIYQLEQTTAGAGVAFFKSLFPNDYYPYNAGELVSVSGLTAHKTVGFNQWDEEWEVGSIDASGNNDPDLSRIRSKNYTAVFPNTNYYFNAPYTLGIRWYAEDKSFISGTSISASSTNKVMESPSNACYLRFSVVGTTTYNHDICINLSDPAKNGTYEPYKAHSYPLDSTVELRGILKLDSNNKLYFDGDVYEYTGKVTRNTILRAYQSGDESLANAITDGTNTVVYSANASTEQAQPYQHLQQCDPNGTEEYVSTGIVPIGHNSFYPENLRAKVEQLPWNFASIIAPTESAFVATRNYTTGSLFIVDNVLYKATSNIANGGTITPNTNCTATTLAEIISALA